jgi:hypothetical protein
VESLAKKSLVREVDSNFFLKDRSLMFIESPCIVNAALYFKSIRNPVLDKTVHFLPWALLVGSTIVTIMVDDPMLTTGIIAAALSLLAFQYLMELVPKSLDAICNRGVLTLRRSSDEARTAELTSCSQPPVLLSQCRNFIEDFDRLINHPYGQWSMAIFFALLGLIIAIFNWSAGDPNIIRMWRWETLNPFLEGGIIMYRVGRLLEFVIDIFIGLIIGFMAWRMVVIGYEVWKVGQKFDVVPKPRHPDNSGGLSPLGNLCLWNALIITIPTIFLGGWIILLARTDYFSGHVGYEYYVTFFLALLPIPIAFAFIGFFFPLWQIHQLMAQKKAEMEREQIGVWYQIDRLDHELLNPDTVPEDFDTKASKLEKMQEVYARSLQYPVWPFNLGIILTFLISQSVPILSLVLTGIGQNVGGSALNITSTAIDILNKFSG